MAGPQPKHRTKLYTRKASKVPGDTLRELTKEATDITGKVWPVGTKLTPLAGGYHNGLNCKYQDMLIAGRTVRFAL